MFDYSSNSNKMKKQQTQTKKEKQKPVVKNAARVKKKNDFFKFVDLFLPDDISNIGTNIVNDYVVPAVRNAIIDTVTYIVGGETRSRRSGGSSSSSYRNYYENKNRNSDRDRSRTGFGYEDILFDSMSDASAVLGAMDDVLDRYGIVSVNELYEFAGVSTTNYMVNKYGWTNLSGASVVRARGGGYSIKLPKPMPID